MQNLKLIPMLFESLRIVVRQLLIETKTDERLEFTFVCAGTEDVISAWFARHAFNNGLLQFAALTRLNQGG